jgi:hypothetical protein
LESLARRASQSSNFVNTRVEAEIQAENWYGRREIGYQNRACGRSHGFLHCEETITVTKAAAKSS